MVNRGLPVTTLVMAVALPCLLDQVDGVSLANVPNPEGCFGDGITSEVGNPTILVPLEQGIRCLRRMTIPKDIALQNIEAYDGMFDLSYVFYDIAKNPSDTKPIKIPKIPSGWSVYDTPDQGKVDLRQLSMDLKAEVEASGANGLFPYKIMSLYGAVRDGHTKTDIFNPMVNSSNGMQTFISLIDTNFLQNGSYVSDPFYLSLNRGSDGKVRVVYKFEDDKGNIIREKTVKRIDGEKGLDGLIKLTTNLGLGYQYHSEGSRMNRFLDQALVGNPLGILWRGSLKGDISLLPACLNVTFEDDGSDELETQWCFYLDFAGPAKELFLKPIEEYNKEFVTPQESFVLFHNFLEQVNEASPYTNTELDPLKNASRTLFKLMAFNQTGIQDKKLNFTLSILPTGTRDEVGGYTMLDNETMILRYSYFTDIINTAELWRKAVKYARDNNANKLIIDIIGNRGGSVSTHYFLKLALYPEMEYNDWKSEYTQRISKRLGRVLTYFESSSDVIAILNEYSDEFVAALKENLDFALRFLDSLVKSYQALENFFTSANFMPSLGTDSDMVSDARIKAMEDANTLADVIASIKNQTAIITDELFTDIFQKIKELTFIPAEIAVAQFKQGTQELFQGGSNVNNTGFYNLWSTIEDYLNAKTLVIQDLPFESYVLLNNGISGSAANSFEQGVRAYATKYAGKVTPMTAVSFGCLGERKTCPLTQFAGGAAGGGNAQLAATYLAGPGLFTLNQFVYFLNETKSLNTTESEKETLQKFADGFDTEYLQQVPEPGSLSGSEVDYAYTAIYPDIVPTSENVVPDEFLNQPPDAYISMWPKPGTVLVEGNQASLLALYTEASKFFMTKPQADNSQTQSPETPEASPSGPSSSGSVLKALYVSLAIVCIVFVV